MATYTKAPRWIPSQRRSALISSVAAGDQIDIQDVLGRPARGVKFELTAATDVIEYKLNNLQRLQKFNETGADTTVLVWSQYDGFPTYSGTGATALTTQDGLLVDSIEIVSLTLGTGTTIDVVVW